MTNLTRSRKQYNSLQDFVERDGSVLSWGTKVINLFKIQFTTLFKDPMILATIFAIPLILLFGIGALVPNHSLLSPCFGMEAVAVSGVIFGNLYYNLTTSTISGNMSTSNYGHKTKLMTIGFITVIVTIIAILFELLVFISFDSLGLFFVDSFVFFKDPHYQALTISWLKLPWLNLIYYIITNILLTVAMWIFIKGFFASNKTFIMFVLSYVLLDIMFGGVLIMTYSSAEVYVSDNGKLLATGYLVSNTSIKNEFLGGDYGNTLKFGGIYSYAKLLVPHYFINQQFSTLFKVGGTQSMGAYGWNSTDGSFWVNWDVMFNSDGSLNESFQWLADAQNYVVNGVGDNGQLLDTAYVPKANIEMAGVTPNENGMIYAYYQYSKSLPLDSSFWKAYAGDSGFIMCTALPYVYIILLTWTGFIFSRVKNN